MNNLKATLLTLLIFTPMMALAEGGVRKLFNLNTVTEELAEVIPGQLYFSFWHGESISIGVFRMVRNQQGHFPGKVNQHGEEMAICTEGQLEMTINDKIYHFGEGELMIIPPFVPHTGKCLTDACTLVSWFTPGRKDEWGEENNSSPELGFLDRDKADQSQ